MYGKNINFDKSFLKISQFIYNFFYSNCTVFFESYLIFMRVINQKETINARVRAIVQIFMPQDVK